MKYFLFFILFTPFVIVCQNTWVLGSSLVDNNLNLKVPKKDNLRFFDFSTNGVNSCVFERTLGQSVKNISSRGIQEICLNADPVNGEIPFYVYSNSGDGFPAFSNDEIFFIKNINGKDEVFGSFTSTGNGQSSTRDAFIFPKNIEKSQYYVVFKNSCTNSRNNDFLFFVEVDVLNETISSINSFFDGNTNEGLAVLENTDGSHTLYFTVFNGTTLEINTIEFNSQTVRDPELKISIPFDSKGGGQGDLEISPDGLTLAFANWTNITSRDILILDICGEELVNPRFVDSDFNFIIELEFSSNSKRLFVGQGGASSVGNNLFSILVPTSNYKINSTTDKVPYTVTSGNLSIELGKDGRMYFSNGWYNTTLNYIEKSNEIAADIIVSSLSLNIFNGIGVSPSFVDHYYKRQDHSYYRIIHNHPLKLCQGEEIELSSSVIDGNIWFVNGMNVSSNAILTLNLVENTSIELSNVNYPCQPPEVVVFEVDSKVDATFYLDTLNCNNQYSFHAVLEDITIPISWFLNGEYYSSFILDTLSIAEDATIELKLITHPNSACSDSTAVYLDLEYIEPYKIVYYNSLVLCQGEEVTLSSSINDGNIWVVNGVQFSDANEITIEMIENTTIELLNINYPCQAVEIVTIEVIYKIKAEFEFNELECPNNYGLVATTEGFETDIIWYLNGVYLSNQSLTNFTILESNPIQIKLVTNPGTLCADSITKTFEIEYVNPSEDKYISPNIFSPNGDGINDYFFPLQYINTMRKGRFFVFDRWGNLVYKGDKLTDCWDGKFNGISSEEGVYTFILEADSYSYCDLFTKKINEIGTITLIY